MKRVACIVSAVVLCFLLMTVSYAETEESESSWDLSGPTEITDEILDVFDQVTEKLMGVSYEPVAHLGTMNAEDQDGVVYCLLCRATVVYPGAKPSYVLMYIHKADDGSAELQNIWDIWVDAHAVPDEKK